VKTALLSDIHANLQALQACMAHAKAQGIDRWALLGDLVGYGGNPQEVVDIAMRLAEEGACMVQGNHDAMAAQPPSMIKVWATAQRNGRTNNWEPRSAGF
jgi:predicted phosphodiesterase